MSYKYIKNEQESFYTNFKSKISKFKKIFGKTEKYFNYNGHSFELLDIKFK